MKKVIIIISMLFSFCAFSYGIVEDTERITVMSEVNCQAANKELVEKFRKKTAQLETRFLGAKMGKCSSFDIVKPVSYGQSMEIRFRIDDIENYY